MERLYISTHDEFISFETSIEIENHHDYIIIETTVLRVRCISHFFLPLNMSSSTKEGTTYLAQIQMSLRPSQSEE